jgi:hypothetical protein
VDKCGVFTEGTPVDAAQMDRSANARRSATRLGDDSRTAGTSSWNYETREKR